MKIKFNPGDHKVQMAKAIIDTLHLGLKEAKDAVEAGEVECPDDKYDTLCQVITEAGGVLFKDEKQLDNIDDAPFENNEDDGINDTFVMSKDSDVLVIESRISISMRLYEHLMICSKDELRILKQNIPLVMEFRQMYKVDKENSATSVLAIRVPQNHNSIETVTALAAIATMIHEVVLKATSKTIVLSDINEEIKTLLR